MIFFSSSTQHGQLLSSNALSEGVLELMGFTQTWLLVFINKTDLILTLPKKYNCRSLLSSSLRLINNDRERRRNWYQPMS
jgi:hypothetical protein